MTLLRVNFFQDKTRCRRRRGSERINVAALASSRKSRFAADGQPLRLASSPLPLYLHWHGDTGEDIAAISIFNYGYCTWNSVPISPPLARRHSGRHLAARLSLRSVFAEYNPDTWLAIWQKPEIVHRYWGKRKGLLRATGLYFCV